MPGKNLIFNPEQILFKKGDPSDGMFVVRSGELLVYLEEQNGEEIELARVGPGGMIGEMALFDRKPRSASVKASKKCEVTHITLKDFEKLMKQIPRWFTALMVTLSSRLRSTNERVQELTDKLESLSPNTSGQLKKALDVLLSVNEAWQTHGEKVGGDNKSYKYFVMENDIAIKHAAKKHKFSQSEFDKIFNGLEQGKIAFEKDGKLHAHQKSSMGRFLGFLSPYMSNVKYSLNEDIGGILSCLKKLCDESAYEPFTATIESVKDYGKNKSKMDISKWDKVFPCLSGVHEDLKIIDISGKEGIRIKKKVLADVSSNQFAVRMLAKSVLVE